MVRETLPPLLEIQFVPSIVKQAALIAFAMVEVAAPEMLRFATETFPEKVEVEFVPVTFTKPDAGVMATIPATAPETIPRVVGRPLHIHSNNAQLKPAAAVAVLVTTKALVASPLAASALPALKPKHPNHNKPAPKTVKGILCIGVGLF